MFIPQLFYILLFLVPLALYTKTSELFEFNKIILVYIFTTLITTAWLIRCLIAKKVIFRRTILDLPLLVFIGSQILATIFSINQRTSFLGYYGRFNGGLLSTLCYSLLYWAYVSNMNHKKTLYAIRYTLYAAILVSLYGILQRFGIDKDIWVQDVVNRVFSTLGQPNWLAAFIVALMPIGWALGLNSKLKVKNLKFLLWLGLSILFSLTLLYTKSRSGFLGFLTAASIFWIGVLLVNRKTALFKEVIKKFLIFNFAFLIVAFATGSPWTQAVPTAPALEGGGTESGTIRRIVWQGAIEIGKHHPIVGTGVETFAYSYYNFRPAEHNLTSEWEFLYNKAHNEFLNIAANTGLVGLFSYIILIIFSIFIFIEKLNFPISIFHFPFKSKTVKLENNMENDKWQMINIALAAGYASILVTNFFGFSVVAVSFLFFLMPAMAVALANSQQSTTNFQLKNLSSSQKILLLIVVSCMLYVVSRIAGYWYSDVLYASGKNKNRAGDFAEGSRNLISAVTLSPNEAIFWDELSYSMASATVANETLTFSQKAIEYGNIANALSPRNINIKRSRASNFLRLAILDPIYLRDAKNTLEEATILAPTDAKIFYNLGLTEVRLGERQEALKTLAHTIDLKPDYRDARFAYALVLIDEQRFSDARRELNYILENISSQDAQVMGQLEEIKGR